MGLRRSAGLVEIRVMADAGEDIEHLAALRCGMADPIGGEQGEAGVRGEGDKALIENLFPAQEMALDFDEDIARGQRCW